jgi:hypothetical protein
VHVANTWQGAFGLHNDNGDGYERTSPMTAFPKHEADAPKACRVPLKPARRTRGGEPRPGSAADRDSPQDDQGLARICARRTIAAAIARPRAMPEAIDTSTSHLGFRCVISEPAPDSLLSS